MGTAIMPCMDMYSWGAFKMVNASKSLTLLYFLYSAYFFSPSCLNDKGQPDARLTLCHTHRVSVKETRKIFAVIITIGEPKGNSPNADSVALLKECTQFGVQLTVQLRDKFL